MSPGAASGRRSKLASPDGWARAKAIFDAVREGRPDERVALLDDLCEDDPTLRTEVERLLALEAGAEAFFDTLDPGAPREAPLPERIGPWRVVREVGRGGMGRVFLAERGDGAFEQRVAIKVVESGAPGIVKRFRQERRILASLDHPNIARLVDGGALEDGRPYLVMEYVEGVPITQYAEAEALELDARLDLFVQVCEAVAFAHRNLVVHRDLKPSNILVDRGHDGRPRAKLLDFGIARLLENRALDVTRTGQRLLTPGYAAPEQIRGDPVTTATDVYALGVLLYELLTGRRPFQAEGRTRWQVEKDILEAPPVAPSIAAGQGVLRARGQIRGDLDWITLMALRKEPDRRYGSVEGLIRDVRRHRRGLPVEARPATVRYRTGAFVRRHRVGTAMTAVALAALVGFGALHMSRVTAERNRAEAAAARAEQVSTFLTDVLASSRDPGADRGALLRVLEPAAVRAQARLHEDPETRAALLHTLGHLYTRLGVLPRADSLLREALALRRRQHRGPHEDVASTLFALGERFVSQPDSARGYFRAAAQMHQALDASDRHDLAWSLLQWDRMLPLDHPDKGRRYREALDMLGRIYGTRSPEVALAMHEYHVLDLAPGDQVEAFREVLAIYLENGLEDDPRTLTTMYNLGLEHEKRGEYDLAFPLFRQAIERGQTVYPPGSAPLLAMTTNFGASLHEQGHLAEADSVLREADEVARASLPDGAAPIGASSYWYGRNLLALGDAVAAERVLRRAVQNYRTRDNTGPRFHRVQIELAQALADQGRLGEAEALLRESAGSLRGAPYERPALERLVRVLSISGKGSEAGPYQSRLDELGGG